MKCKNGMKDCFYIHNPEGECDACTQAMTNKLETIVSALGELQVEAMRNRSKDGKYFWADHYLEEALTNVKMAIKEVSK